jgi:hypothetical protein
LHTHKNFQKRNVCVNTAQFICASFNTYSLVLQARIRPAYISVAARYSVYLLYWYKGTSTGDPHASFERHISALELVAGIINSLAHHDAFYVQLQEIKKKNTMPSGLCRVYADSYF